jgi:multicomponent Na+:H+ antiporter subunit E
VRSVGYVLALAAIWVLLWGSASPANMLSGLLVGTLLVLMIPGLRADGGRLRPRVIAIGRLAGHFLWVTVKANAELVREVLDPSRLRPGVVDIALPDCSEEVLTLITNLLALAPGTMPLELQLPDTGSMVLSIHVLRLTDVEQVRRDVLHLADLAERAFGAPR